MKTKEIEVGGQKVKIRRIGAGAAAELQDLFAATMSPRVMAFQKSKSGLSVDEVEAALAAAPDLQAEARACIRKAFEAKVFFVCACIVDPPVTPETFDITYDADEFEELHAAILAFNRDHREGRVVPFGAGQAGATAS